MSCNSNYIWSGDSYELSETNNAYILHLGGGRTICDIVNSSATRTPDHILLYSGDDPEVPHSLQCTDRDLVIKCSDSASIQDVSVCYFDSVSGVWRGPYNPENSYTDRTRTWFVFRKYLDVVVPFRSEVKLQLAGELRPIDPPSGGDSASSASTIQIIQPPEEFNLELEVFIYNDRALTDINTVINTAEDHHEFPVLIFDGDAFVEFPADGVTKTTAGQYVVIDLTNLDYSGTVYIKWIWRGVASQAVAGSGFGVYPAYTLTNPDNIGLIWETNM